MSVEDIVIPSIEESICKASVNNYSIVEDRYYEHFYWCPGHKKTVLKTEELQSEEGSEVKEDSFMSKIKRNETSN
jgi:hypothetical protein